MITKYAQPKQKDIDRAKNTSQDRLIELKYDGARQFLISQEDSLRLTNKRGTEKTNHFPEITKQVTMPEGVVLDGEIIVQDELHPHGNKQLLQSRDAGTPVLRDNGKENFKEKMKMEQHPATFVAFDITTYKGENVKDLEIEERRKLLEAVVDGLPSQIQVSKRYDTLTQAWEEVVKNKMEGVITKKPESRYPRGRTSQWRKVKNIKDTLVTAKDYEEHNKGVTVIAEDENHSDHRLTVNGHKSKEVKSKIDSEGEADIEISYLEKSKNDKYREPRFKRLHKP
jgi:ATP-dependent DNA ligase